MSGATREENSKAIRPDVIDSLKRYRDDRIPTGGFLAAVLSNDLKQACGRADSDNRETLVDIVTWIYNEMPSGAWGSPERVRDWLARGDG